MRPSNGGGQLERTPTSRFINPEDIALPKGYRIEAVASNLTFPSGITFDEKGQAYILESGYSYGEVFTEPKLLRLEPDGRTTTIASSKPRGPWNGVDYHDGAFYISEGGMMEGRILKVSPDGTISTIVTNLPSLGDHHTNGPVIRNGYVYFSQGTATNSGVVGNDNADFGWLERKKDFHDIPCKELTLTGENFETDNVLTEAPDDKAVTGAYQPYNTSTTKGQIIKGVIPCSGAIMRTPLNGGQVELVAWGLRNPFGLAFSPDGKLYITENSYDVRGSRPVWGTGDVLWHIQPGKWYGWPDFAGGKSLTDADEFKAPGKKAPKPLLLNYPNTPPKPAAVLGVHSSASGFDFSKTNRFGYQGHAFVTQFGDMAPKVGKVMSPVGFKVVRVNVYTGVVEDFAVNKGKRNGPATWLKKGGLERPVAARFSPDGTALYIVDFGIMTVSKKESVPYKGTGVVWKITKVGS